MQFTMRHACDPKPLNPAQLQYWFERVAEVMDRNRPVVKQVWYPLNYAQYMALKWPKK